MVISWRIEYSCVITASFRFCSDAALVSGLPSIKILPEVGRSTVESMLIVVVLPAPLGPSSPKNSPVPIVKERSSTAVKLPNFFVSSRTSIILRLSVLFLFRDQQCQISGIIRDLIDISVDSLVFHAAILDTLYFQA